MAYNKTRLIKLHGMFMLLHEPSTNVANAWRQSGIHADSLSENTWQNIIFLEAGFLFGQLKFRPFFTEFIVMLFYTWRRTFSKEWLMLTENTF